MSRVKTIKVLLIWEAFKVGCTSFNKNKILEIYTRGAGYSWEKCSPLQGDDDVASGAMLQYIQYMNMYSGRQWITIKNDDERIYKTTIK